MNEAYNRRQRSETKSWLQKSLRAEADFLTCIATVRQYRTEKNAHESAARGARNLVFHFAQEVQFQPRSVR